ncbi:class I adenylate-forming enzyme family protein [Nocardioides marmoribigeumensis]|uniref:Long-chain acyl-CoA synthetase n=1 Tax=Nocardioides marmoribigeumensis TaxID=433649 RepID=A0ABU2BSV8_9ACTN|nr:AMP-binding protein [Nocardioides marmoribigeumensis]MDR7361718.1 long-chain acyl-CoA synthetase [Nocardioides marmoribigeumensis]
MTANLADLLSRASATSPDTVALVGVEGPDREVSLTWRELDDLASRLASGLERLGLVAGNRVALATANRVEFVALYFAVLRARLVAVPVNPRSATGELLRVVSDSGARLLVVDASTAESGRSVVSGVQEALAASPERPPTSTLRAAPRLLVLDVPVREGEAAYADLESGEPTVLPESVDPEALAVLLYTSGASGRPRAAMLTHRALLANVEQVARIEPAMVGPDDVLYGVLPLFHVYGLNAVLGAVVRQAARLVVVDGFDAERSLEQVQRHGVTIVPIAPAVLAYWRTVEDLRARLSGVRMLLSGSAPLAPELVEEFVDRTGVAVHQGYGLTEAAPVVTSTIGSPRVKRGSVGVAIPGVSLRLVDETGRAPEGEDPGEIWVSGDNLFSGYWPDRAEAPVEGWLATGDVGFLDGDGDLFLVDRLKELVIVSGFNVYPSEVEDVIEEVEGVREVAVVGVPDERTGEAVVAYVRPVDPAADPDQVRAAVEEACARRLARFKQPTRVEVVEALPRTVTGKVAKGRLRATLRRERLGLIE